MPPTRPMIVDCDTCPVRGTRCEGCVVTALTAPRPAELPLDPSERRAVETLVGAGLVAREQVAGLHARREPWSGSRAAV